MALADSDAGFHTFDPLWAARGYAFGGYAGFPYAYGAAYYGHPVAYHGLYKREAEAEAKSEADPFFYSAYGGYYPGFYNGFYNGYYNGYAAYPYAGFGYGRYVITWIICLIALYKFLSLLFLHCMNLFKTLINNLLLFFIVDSCKFSL